MSQQQAVEEQSANQTEQGEFTPCDNAGSVGIRQSEFVK
jgi:hypothetical protein